MVKLRKKLNSILPGTPCTAELRAKVEAYAQKEQCSIAEVQRAAIEFFLALDVTQNDKTVIRSRN